MKRILVFLFALIAFNFANAQDNYVLLEQTAAKTEKYTSLKIDFNMTVENLHNAKRETYSGNAAYRNGLYKMDIMGQVVFSDGKTNWTYLKDAEEINITTNTGNTNVMTNPKALLHNYKDNYKVNYISDKFEKNRALVEYDLIPKKIEDKKFSKITLKIDKAKKQIYSIRYVGKDGMNYLIEIYKLVENPTIADSEIKYSSSLFPGAEVIDMR